MSQQDLLAHPNLKVFVTHGGLLSLQEALYHQKPLVGIPLGNDQKPNLMRAQKKGYAIMLDWISLTADELITAIDKVLNDADMKRNLNKNHALFLDGRDPPLVRAVWWIEYVMRHGSAEFLRPDSLNLNWFQYHLLDVIGVVLLISILVMFIIFMLCFVWFKICCTKKQKMD